MRALIPMEEGRPLLGTLPETVEVDVWDASGPPPGGSQGVTFWVPPFRPLPSYAQVFSELPDLRAVQTLTAGYDEVSAALPKGLILCNAGGVHDGPTAEWAVTALLAVLRQVPYYVRGQREGVSRNGESDSLISRRVMLLGHGGIGRAVDRRLAGFEAEIVRVASRARAGVHGPDSLRQLLSGCDAVIIAVPLGIHTRGLVDGDFLGRLPDGAVVVNVSRGGVVDQRALAAELWSGRLRAALDVSTPDPLAPDDPLRNCPNLLYTPHIAGATSLALPRAFGLVGEQLRRWAIGEPLVNVVVGPSTAVSASSRPSDPPRDG